VSHFSLVQWVHSAVPLLLVPVIAVLFACIALACVEIGFAIAERSQLKRSDRPTNTRNVETRAHRRIERADILTRLSPMLGLMATLISLGPGLTALSNGNLNLLAEAMLTAFDTTVLGLAAGAVGFVIGRLRRRWYEEALARWERQPA
jgi:biopolymer transport protein ExbB/TolQ